MTLISIYWKVCSFCLELTTVFLFVVLPYFTVLGRGLWWETRLCVCPHVQSQKLKLQNVIAGFCCKKMLSISDLPAIAPEELSENY